MPKILYKFPTRHRGEKALRCLENIFNLAEHDNFQILMTLDLDDLATANRQFHEEVKKFGSKVLPVYGFSQGKVNAVNRDMYKVKDWDMLITMSDDFVFLVPGFDKQILADMQVNFPDWDGFLHYPDGTPAEDKLCTMSIMGKTYYDRFGYIYHPDYTSVYCDNEATQVAKILGKYRYIDKHLFNHMHPAWGKGAKDALYTRNENVTVYTQDHAIYEHRLHRNFGI